MILNIIIICNLIAYINCQELKNNNENVVEVDPYSEYNNMCDDDNNENEMNNKYKTFNKDNNFINGTINVGNKKINTSSLNIKNKLFLKTFAYFTLTKNGIKYTFKLVKKEDTNMNKYTINKIYIDNQEIDDKNICKYIDIIKNGKIIKVIMDNDKVNEYEVVNFNKIGDDQEIFDPISDERFNTVLFKRKNNEKSKRSTTNLNKVSIVEIYDNLSLSFDVKNLFNNQKNNNKFCSCKNNVNLFLTNNFHKELDNFKNNIIIDQKTHGKANSKLFFALKTLNVNTKKININNVNKFITDFNKMLIASLEYIINLYPKFSNYNYQIKQLDNINIINNQLYDLKIDTKIVRQCIEIVDYMFKSSYYDSNYNNKDNLLYLIKLISELYKKLMIVIKTDSNTELIATIAYIDQDALLNNDVEKYSNDIVSVIKKIENQNDLNELLSKKSEKIYNKIKNRNNNTYITNTNYIINGITSILKFNQIFFKYDNTKLYNSIKLIVAELNNLFKRVKNIYVFDDVINILIQYGYKVEKNTRVNTLSYNTNNINFEDIKSKEKVSISSIKHCITELEKYSGNPIINFNKVYNNLKIIDYVIENDNICDASLDAFIDKSINLNKLFNSIINIIKLLINNSGNNINEGADKLFDIIMKINKNTKFLSIENDRNSTYDIIIDTSREFNHMTNYKLYNNITSIYIDSLANKQFLDKYDRTVLYNLFEIIFYNKVQSNEQKNIIFNYMIKFKLVDKNIIRIIDKFIYHEIYPKNKNCLLSFVDNKDINLYIKDFSYCIIQKNHIRDPICDNICIS